MPQNTRVTRILPVFVLVASISFLRRDECFFASPRSLALASTLVALRPVVRTKLDYSHNGGSSYLFDVPGAARSRMMHEYAANDLIIRISWLFA